MFHASVEGEDGLFALFLETDKDNFFTSELGKIWYMRVPKTGAMPVPVEANEDVTPIPRRIEPEVHQSANGPHIIWNQRNDYLYHPGCSETDGMTLVGFAPELEPPGY
jgi:hypothetical protein